MLTGEKQNSRSESPSKVMSSGQLANQNGEKDWEHVSNASSPASPSEYTGPKLFKEPSLNKFIIHNALSHCCLAGKVNESQKNKIIDEVEKSSTSHFLILLRDSNCQFRAIYTRDGQSEELHRLCGVGPRAISSSDVEAIYKYSSDGKQFNTLPSRTLSMSVDAFTIPAHLWHTKKHGTPKKVATPK
uniref:CKK domain-containing protein n=1 Tax=Sinocyclocheilus anshuiensis TaxID=1608454 RepID=A0A671RA25_9TELE